MKNLLFLLLFTFIILVSVGQPADYYKTAINKSGDVLKSELYKIIKGHDEFDYTSTKTDN